MKRPKGLDSVVDRLRLKFRQLEAPETLPVFRRRPTGAGRAAAQLRELREHRRERAPVSVLPVVEEALQIGDGGR